MTKQARAKLQLEVSPAMEMGRLLDALTYTYQCERYVEGGFVCVVDSGGVRLHGGCQPYGDKQLYTMTHTNEL